MTTEELNECALSTDTLVALEIFNGGLWAGNITAIDENLPNYIAL